ncbi:SPFH domain-containing protein [Caulobacter sp. 17J80-11]|uniref:SPFH domain-containing protein n=1 Tax=Caulobacter sp. 17J80-11 TaxID=2763502 RepID=UPI0016538313|nr:slipin family protein [Caulobacter sp. 17J80-11]
MDQLDTVWGYVLANVPIAIGVLVFVILGFRINQEYQRSVVYRLGRYKRTSGPGVFWIIPLLERSVKVDVRINTVTLQPQDAVTRDGVPVKVNAVLWYKVDNPAATVNAVQDPHVAIVQAAETTLRDAIGQHDLDDLLKHRTQLNTHLLGTLEAAAKKWGVDIDAVELRDLDIPEQMQRAIAREAEASREARARLIKAQGEANASETLVEAAKAIMTAPAALEIRRLQALTEIGVEHNSTIIVAMPTELTQLAARMATPQT